VNRRDALAALFALCTTTRGTRSFAQARLPQKPVRIGMLPDPVEPGHRLFIDAMRERGWSTPRDFVELKSGLDFGVQIEQAARRIVEQAPDVIFTVNTAYALAAHRLTATVPIVMWTSGYPVEAGLARSLARPGKNVTGNSLYAGIDIWGKLLELLREASPGIKRVGVLWDYTQPFHPQEEVAPLLDRMQHAASALRIAANVVQVRHPDQLPGALAEIDAKRPQAMLITTGPPLFTRQAEVMEFAVARRLPTITDFRWRAEIVPYPLFVYAPSTLDLVVRAVGYVDRILRGAAPGELPIQQPAKFQLVVNLTTARRIGLTLPRSILLRSDQMVE